MKLAKYLDAQGQPAVGLVEDDSIRPLSLAAGQFQTLAEILEASDPAEAVRFLIDPAAKKLQLGTVPLLPPIDDQEVWAAGVTYKRSRSARMEESVSSATVYDKVYSADRPELFFKANPWKVVGPGKMVRIRKDAEWNVPEPELALVIDRRMHIVGYTIGNDMSSRDIEGENPLYLPQAKVYDGSCSLGPWITLPSGMPERDATIIRMVVTRGGKSVFQGQTSLAQLARTPESLVEWLGRDNTFRGGAILLTGTGIVPEKEFTLAAGDVVSITIDGIGTLTNTVERRK
jgi:2-dehydro-3-deoxy-D-arabinonate dehydratase